MAEIQEYLPQVSSPEPVGGVSPNIELAGAVGRSIQNLGGTLEQAGEALHRRNSQRESADVYSQTAQQRADSFSDMDSGLQDGSYDKDKFFEKFDKDSADYGSKITTPEAKNYFERQNARLRGSLLKHSTLGEAQVASREAVGQLVSAKNANAKTIFDHPDQFDDINQGMLEHSDQMANVGAIPAKMRDKLLQDTSKEYAVSAVLGTAQINPKAAKTLLDDKKFSTYFTTEQRESLMHSIDRVDRDKRLDQDQALKRMQDAQKMNYMAWSRKMAQPLEDNQVTTKDTTDAMHKGVLTAEQKEHWDQWIARRQDRDFKTDPKDYNELARRVLLDDSDPTHIDDVDQLKKEALARKIAPTGTNSIQSLETLLAKTPEEKQYKQSEKALMDAAKRQVLFKDGLGNPSLLGDQNLAKFKADYAQAKKEAQDKGQNVKELSDTASPLYFGNRMEHYKASLEDQFRYEQEQRTNKANEDNKNARKPNESIEDWKKRTGR